MYPFHTPNPLHGRPETWRKRRTHFHDFMLNVHSRLQVRESLFFHHLFTFFLLNEQFTSLSLSLMFQKQRVMEDPLEVVAEELVKESILLCLDEFMVCFPGGNLSKLLL